MDLKSLKMYSSYIPQLSEESSIEESEYQAMVSALKMDKFTKKINAVLLILVLLNICVF
jgi:hypothetical protein